MAENKTKPGKENINEFLASFEPGIQDDCKTLIKIMKKITGKQPVLWGGAMIGFGTYHYKYASGHEGDSFLTGFSPRKANLTIYGMTGFDRHKELMAKLGKYKTAKSCLYIKKLSDVDVTVLEKLIAESYKCMLEHYLKMVKSV
ncbi:MAG: DUF1801 domain-containing protein [Bacteroidia bacterium]